MWGICVLVFWVIHTECIYAFRIMQVNMWFIGNGTSFKYFRPTPNCAVHTLNRFCSTCEMQNLVLLMFLVGSSFVFARHLLRWFNCMITKAKENNLCLIERTVYILKVFVILTKLSLNNVLLVFGDFNIISCTWSPRDDLTNVYIRSNSGFVTGSDAKNLLRPLIW